MPGPITFATAIRTSAIPLIAFYGESGTGKTYSALLLARGIAGPAGVIKMIDTERGRGSLFADDPKIAGYQVAQLEEPYSPKRHIEFLEAAEEGASVVVLDSGSHEWEGPGGVLDMAGDGQGLAKWKEPKKQHQYFIGKLLRMKVPIIVCLRAKYKTRMLLGTEEMAKAGMIQRQDIGKKVVIKDQDVEPIQAGDFIFEATMHVQINQGHSIVVTKKGTDELRSCLPADNTSPITIESGQSIARWIKGGGTRVSGPQTVAQPASQAPQQPATAPAPASGDDLEAKRIRGAIWGLVKDEFADGKELQQHLWDEGMLETEETLQTAPVNRLNQVFNALKSKRSK